MTLSVQVYACMHMVSVVQCSLGHVIGVAFFRRDFSGVKRTCWTTGSWRSCLSLEVVSSIPAWSTIIYRFLCGFICVSLCQSIKIKPTNMYIASARAQFKINTHRCWNWHHVHSRQVVSCPVSVLPKVFCAPVLRTSGSWNLPVRMEGSLVRNFNNYYVLLIHVFDGCSNRFHPCDH